MKKPKKIEETMLTAFVDGQLDTEDSEAIIKAMDDDENLREQVYKLRRTKDLMKLSFANKSPHETGQQKYTHTLHRQCVTKMTAAFTALAIVLGSGFAGYKYCSHTVHMPTQVLAELPQRQGERVILHISESGHAQSEKTLTYMKSFLNQHRKNNKVRIEVITNAGDIDLLRQRSPLSSKVMNMIEKLDTEKRYSHAS